MSQASGKVALVEKQIVKDVPAFGPGDTVRIHVKIKEGDKERIQIFEGTAIAFNNRGSRRSFTVRKISHGVGVERIFPLYSPTIAKIERIMEGRVRRAKIYYLRNLKGKAAKIRNDAETQN